MQHQRGKILLLLIVGVASLMDVTQASSYSSIGDVVVYQNETVWRCDKIFCPEKTHLCHISKQKDPQDAAILLRENTCYGPDKVIIEQKITKEPVDPQQSISLQIDSYRNGVISSQSGGNYGGNYGGYNGNSFNYHTLSPDEARELNINLNNIQQNVQQNVDHIQQQVQENVDHIHQQVQENVRDINNSIQRQLAEMQSQFQNMFH